MNVILGRCLGSQINVWTTFKERQKNKNNAGSCHVFAHMMLLLCLRQS